MSTTNDTTCISFLTTSGSGNSSVCYLDNVPLTETLSAIATGNSKLNAIKLLGAGALWGIKWYILLPMSVREVDEHKALSELNLPSGQIEILLHPLRVVCLNFYREGSDGLPAPYQLSYSPTYTCSSLYKEVGDRLFDGRRAPRFTIVAHLSFPRWASPIRRIVVPNDDTALDAHQVVTDCHLEIVIAPTEFPEYASMEEAIGNYEKKLKSLRMLKKLSDAKEKVNRLYEELSSMTIDEEFACWMPKDINKV